MRSVTVVGVLFVAALASLSSNAASLDVTRERNRQIILAGEEQPYDPTGLVEVLVAEGDTVTQSLVTEARALEMRLDFLSRHGLSLEPPAESMGAAEPAWPLLGTIEMHERGWVDSNAGEAKCPTVTPTWPPAVRDAVDDLVEGDNNEVGIFETSVSQHWRHATDTSSKGMLPSWIKHWSVGETPGVDAYDPIKYGSYAGVGYILRGAFEWQDVEGWGLFCEKDSTQVHVDAIVRPLVDRIDDDAV